MIKELKYYFTVDRSVPSDEDIQQCIDLQKENPDVIIILKWYFPWNGWHELWFSNEPGRKPREDIKTIEDARERMPKRYGV